MRRPLYFRTAVATALCATVVAAQPTHVRTGTLLDHDSRSDYALASDGDLIAVLYVDGFFNAAPVYVRVSDGRGLAWSEPQKIDHAASSNNKMARFDSLSVRENAIYAYWWNNGNGAAARHWDMHFNVSRDGGGTWLTTDVVIDKGLPAGVGGVHDSRFVVSSDVTGDHLYFLYTVTAEPGVNPGTRVLRMVSSHDAGRTFSDSRVVSTADGADVEGFAIAADGVNVHVAWADDRNSRSGSNDIFYRRSTDGGASWTGPETQLDSSGPGVGNTTATIQAAVLGSEIAVGWIERLTSPINGEVRLAFSADGGQTFGPDGVVGGYVPGQAYVSELELTYGRSALVVAWTDGRVSPIQAYVTSTDDSGATWRPDTAFAAGFSTFFIRLAGGDSGVLGLSYESTDTYATYSLDDGHTWATGFRVGIRSCPRGRPEMAYNQRYDNFAVGFMDSPGCGTNQLYVAGFRPQTLTANGFVVGPTQVSFELSAFSGSVPFAAVVGSLTPGSVSLPFGDGRNLGLAPDPLLTATLSLVSGPLGTTLDASGAGKTPPLAVVLPAGAMFRFAAFELDLSTGVKFGRITDAIRVQVP